VPTTFDAVPNLSGSQRALLASWLPGAEVVRDLSWGLVETTVLEVVLGGTRLVVKAGGAGDGHIRRELEAHAKLVQPWVAAGRAPTLLHGDVDAKVLVTHYLSGVLVEGRPEQGHPEIFRQAGELLAQMHAQDGVADAGYEQAENAKAVGWLDRGHRIAPEVEARLRDEISTWPDAVATLVPTHGDWQPRNWLIDSGTVRVIDFGRAALRPALSDLVRLAAQDFAGDPRLESAFFEGYGPDPREPEAWHRHRVREAIGTACWSYAVGDEQFERQGLRMIDDALSEAGAAPPPVRRSN